MSSETKTPSADEFVEPPCDCNASPGCHMADCAVMVAQDAWIMRHDAIIIARERELGSNMTEVGPTYRRVFRYGMQHALAHPSPDVRDAERSAVQKMLLLDYGYTVRYAAELTVEIFRAIDTAIAKDRDK